MQPPDDEARLRAVPKPRLRALMVRHGESEWNALGRWQGHADSPLSALGEAQAIQAVQSLGSFDAVVSSDLQRARRSAELIADELGVGPVFVDARLREIDAAEWQGLTHADIESQWPGYLEAGRRPPGFEAPEVAALRAADALFELAAARPGAVVFIVSHSGTIRALRTLAGNPMARMPNLAGTWFDVIDDRLVAGDEVHLLALETMTDTE